MQGTPYKGKQMEYHDKQVASQKADAIDFAAARIEYYLTEEPQGMISIKQSLEDIRQFAKTIKKLLNK